MKCCTIPNHRLKQYYGNADIKDGKMTYEYFFESEYGMETGIVEALNRKALIAKMKRDLPDDIGSDGFAVDQDGNDFPLDW
tara:strand:+ start:73 stop:315 length:243 start_codon:yes stop_codon:yes gene_type:complete